MTLVLIVLLPLFGAVIPLAAARRGRDMAAVSAGLLVCSGRIGHLLSMVSIQTELGTTSSGFQ